MKTRFLPTTIWFTFFFTTITVPARAQFAVVDVAAINQLVAQVNQIKQQIQIAEDTLTQAQRTHAAITGRRGMEALLNSINRNYLPTTWSQLLDAAKGVGAAYGALSADINSTILRHAILTQAAISHMDPSIAATLDERRRSAALLESLARSAIENTSNRFASIQQLTGAIQAATDQKAILDLQARISIEASMLQNENTKLLQLYKAAQALEETEHLRADELAISSIGNLAALPPMGLN